MHTCIEISYAINFTYKIIVLIELLILYISSNDMIIYKID